MNLHSWFTLNIFLTRIARSPTYQLSNPMSCFSVKKPICCSSMEILWHCFSKTRKFRTTDPSKKKKKSQNCILNKGILCSYSLENLKILTSCTRLDVDKKKVKKLSEEKHGWSSQHPLDIVSYYSALQYPVLIRIYYSALHCTSVRMCRVLQIKLGDIQLTKV